MAEMETWLSHYFSGPCCIYSNIYLSFPTRFVCFTLLAVCVCALRVVPAFD